MTEKQRYEEILAKLQECDELLAGSFFTSARFADDLQGEVVKIIEQLNNKLKTL